MTLYCYILLLLSFQYLIILRYINYITCYMIMAQNLPEPILVLPQRWLYHSEAQNIEGTKCFCIICRVRCAVLCMRVNCGHLILSGANLRLLLHEIQAKSLLKSLLQAFSHLWKGNWIPNSFCDPKLDNTPCLGRGNKKQD